MKKSGLMIFFASLLSTVACATTGPDFGGDHAAMIAQAEDAYKAVEKTGGAWRDTGEMISSARKEAEAGNSDKAYELAKAAYEEAVNASEQQKSSQSAAPWLF